MSFSRSERSHKTAFRRATVGFGDSGCSASRPPPKPAKPQGNSESVATVNAAIEKKKPIALIIIRHADAD